MENFWALESRICWLNLVTMLGLSINDFSTLRGKRVEDFATAMLKSMTRGGGQKLVKRHLLTTPINGQWKINLFDQKLSVTPRVKMCLNSERVNLIFSLSTSITTTRNQKYSKKSLFPKMEKLQNKNWKSQRASKF